MSSLLLPVLALLLGPTSPPWSMVGGGVPLEQGILPPSGYHRSSLPETSFGSWLRRLPLRPVGSPVRLFDGRRKENQEAHVAVLDLDVGDRDLQQCADAVMRLWAEYLLARACPDAIAFDFTSGDRARWSDWRQGMRPEVEGNRVRWERRSSADESYAAFRAYLETVFTYAGSASLERELERVSDPSRPEPGDVFVQGGFPGHAVLVLDVAENEAGERIFLLGQSFMPAQDFHVLRAPGSALSPWYAAKAAGELNTPEWGFRYGDLRRFPDPVCP